jgi:hypothetical protein
MGTNIAKANAELGETTITAIVTVECDTLIEPDRMKVNKIKTA